MPDPTATKPNSMRRFLEQETRPDHERLHTHPLLSRLMEDGLDLQTYISCLKAHLDFTNWALRATQPYLPAAQLVGLKRSAERLANDIAERPVTSTCATSGITCHSSALGALYVAEGARFGRQTISTTLAGTLPNAPRSYFAAPSTPQSWTALLNDLETRADPRTALGGATAAFRTMETCADRALCDLQTTP